MAKKRKPLKTVMRAAMRKLWLQSEARYEALKRCRVKVPVGKFKNGNIKYKTMLKCSMCEGLFEKLEVDHIQEIGEFRLDRLTEWVEKALLCGQDNLRGVCKACHREKTNAYKEALDDL